MILRCSACDKPTPPETVRYTMFVRSPQQYSGTTAAHLCAECGRQMLKVFKESRKAISKYKEAAMVPATANET